MAKLKTVLTFVLAGALVGNLVTTFTAPRFMEWYNSTELATQTVCNLPDVIQKVTSQLIQAQLMGTGIGAGLFLVLGILFVRRRPPSQQSAPPPAAPTQA